MKILLLDLDGTLIETVSGKQFPDPFMDDWKFKKHILGAMANYLSIEEKDRSDGVYIAILTNQGGVNDGYVTPMSAVSKVEYIFANIELYMENESVVLCKSLPSRPTDVLNPCQLSFDVKGERQKPKIKMFQDALDPFDKDEIGRVLYVGDASGKEARKISVGHKGKGRIDGRGTVIETNEGEWHFTIRGSGCGIGDLAEVTMKNRGHTIEIQTKKHLVVAIKPERGKILTVLECYKFQKDHSDSDLKAAEAAQIPYMDVDEFIEKYYTNHD